MVNTQHSKVVRETTTSDKDPMVKFVVDEFEKYEKFHSDRFEKDKNIYKDWLGEPEKKGYDWQNNVHVPMTFEAEQTISPRIFAAIFPDDAPLEIQAEGDVDEQIAIKIKSTLRHDFRVANVEIHAGNAISQATLLGTGYLYAPWLFRQKWQISAGNGQRYQAVTDNRNSCEIVDYFELFPHPAKVTVDDELPLIRRRYCDAEYLKKLSNMPQFKFENLKEALESEPIKGLPSVIQDDSGNYMEIRDREQYEILEYWGCWDDSYKKDDKVVTRMAVPYWIMVVNRKIKIRAIPNPYNHQIPPFVKITLYNDLKKNWFGIGIGQIGKPAQDRINKIVNQRLDNVDLVLNKQGVYNGHDLLINTDKLKMSKPGQFHKVSDVNLSIKFMDMPEVTASSYKEEEIAKADYRESTGATMPLMPTDEGQHRTASGINLLQGAAGARFKPILRKIEYELIQQLGMIYLSNLQQFMSIPRWVQKINKDGTQEPILVNPEDIQAKVYFIPTGISEMMNKEMQIGQLMRFREISANDPTINRSAINKRIATLMGFKDIDEIVLDQNQQRQPGGLSPEMQMRVKQRLAEGASPEQIKLELLGNQPPQQQNMGMM